MEQTQNVTLPQGLPQTVAGLFTSDAFKKQIIVALPKHMNAERFMRAALTEVRKNPALEKCSSASFASALLTAFQSGLEIGGVLGQAYLVPFKAECQLIVGYKGMIALAHRSGKIANLQAEVVREGDVFECEYGSSPMLKHKPLFEDRPITHAYAYASIIGGGFQYAVMSKGDIDRIRGKSDLWNKHYAEMAKKTALRKLFKTLPISAELTQVMAFDEEKERGDVLDVGVDINGSVDVEPMVLEPVHVTQSDVLLSKIENLI